MTSTAAHTFFSPSPSPAFSLLVEARGTGMPTSAVSRDLEALGMHIRMLDGRDAHRFVASVASAAAMTKAERDLRDYFGTHLTSCVDRVVEMHVGGKIRTISTTPLETSDDLALAYTPGVGRAAQLIAADDAASDVLTARRNTVAIVTDGTAVLGLGDLGPRAALPVMEGKAALFDRLAAISAVPLCLDTKDVDQIVSTVTAIAPSFGAINLEDISAPRCFEIERRLDQALDIPVFHDDQHGTAIVVTAALNNALAVVGKPLETARIVVSGAGAAGTAITYALLAAGAKNIVVWAPVGVLHPSINVSLPAHKRALAKVTNPAGVTGDLADALRGADAFIGVSGPNLVRRSLVEDMASQPILFGLANPTPEFDPGELQDLDAIIATGRSDFPNQINNVLAFPGVFRGALDATATSITPAMRRAASEALAALGRTHLAADHLLPDVLDPDVVPAVADAVRHAASRCTHHLTRPRPRASR